MKRPFTLLGFSLLAASALAAYRGPERSAVWSAVLAVMGISALFCAAALGLAGKRARKRQQELSGLSGWKAPSVFRAALWAGLVLLAAALCLFRYTAAAKREMLPAEGLDGKRVHIRGTVLDYPEESGGKAYYTVRAERVTEGGKALDLPEFSFRLSTYRVFPCRPWDTLECTVTLYAFADSGELYSGRNSWWAKGIAVGGYLSVYDSAAVIPCTDAPPGKLFAELRHILGRSFERLLPREEAGLIRAMLLGERDRVSDSAYSHFKLIGASHLLVISGLHMAAMAAFLSLLFRSLPFGRTGKNLLIALGVVFFLCLTGFPVSALRSGLMFLLYLLADCLGREPDSVNSLGFAVFVICLGNPFSGGDLGFALSVFSTLGILLWADSVARTLLRPFHKLPRLRRLLAPAASSLGVTLSVMLGTLPIQMAVFGGISLLAPLANLVLIFPCTLLLYCSVAGAFLGLLPLPGLALPAVFCAGWLARFALWAAEKLSRIPAAYYSLRGSQVMLMAALVLTGLLASKALKLGRAGLCTVLAASVLLWSGCQTPAGAGDTVTFSAISGSSCVAVVKGDRAAVLNPGGDDPGGAVFLLSQSNVRHVETLCLSRRGGGAEREASELLKALGADRIVLPRGANLGSALALAGAESDRLYVADGEPFSVLEGVTATASQGMKRITLEANGVTVAVETGGSGEGECQVLFTGQAASLINSPFTVLQNDGILEEKVGASEAFWEGSSARCLLPGDNGLFLEVRPDGTLRIRGESQCLRSEREN